MSTASLNLQKGEEETGTDYHDSGGIPEDVPILFALVQQPAQTGGSLEPPLLSKVAKLKLNCDSFLFLFSCFEKVFGFKAKHPSNNHRGKGLNFGVVIKNISVVKLPS
nr:hypothetical protein [uncultured archaeon]